MEKLKQRWKQVRYTKDPDALLGALIGKRYEEYRLRWQRAENLESFQEYPLHIDFELQYGCNLKCPHCILQINSNELVPQHPYRAENRSKRISFDLFKRIIDEGVRYGLSAITVGVNNEPLLLKDIAKHIQYARDNGIVDIIMLTNATLLTKEKALELLESGLTKLCFSIDAIREETYRLLRPNGDLAQVTENINRFLALKKSGGKDLPITRVSYVKCKVNESQTDEFIRYWETKVDCVCIQAFMTPAYGYSNYNALKDTLQIENEDIKKSGPCPQPYQRLTVYHDGSVHPCCNWYGSTMILGNVNSDSIHEIWNSKRMRDLRKAVNSEDQGIVPKECRICKNEVFG